MEAKKTYKENADEIIRILNEEGFEGYFVGGCVRDMVMGREYNDIDIATSALPEKTKDIFEDRGYKVYETGIKHGTVSVSCGGNIYEVTTYRIDGSYSDSRHPDSVEFTDKIALDLSRRDFTINAMAMDINGNIVDPFGGMDDIKNKIIRCVGEAEQRFSEDALRILRGMRFASVFNFEIDDEAMNAMRVCAHLIPNVAGERIFVEFGKMVCGVRAAEVIYRCADVIDWTLFPERFTGGMLTYEMHDVIGALSSLSEDRNLRLTALMCMCGKNKGRTDSIVRRFIERMKTDRATADSIKYVTSQVFEPIDKNNVKRSVINREIAKWGSDNLLSVLEIKEMMEMLDVIPFEAELSRVYDICFEIINQGGALTLAALQVNGNDLCEIGIKKSPKTGEILNFLLDEVVEERIENEKSKLLSFVRERFLD